MGSVRLNCSNEGLGIDLLRVGRFAAGFAFVGLAHPVSFRVPFAAIRGLVREGPVLHLTLDPQAAAPYNRFALCRFSENPHRSLLRALRTHVWVRLLTILGPLLAVVALAVFVPRDWLGGFVGFGACGLILAWLTWRLSRGAVTWWLRGGPQADRLGRGFEHTLSQRLGLVPVDVLGVEPTVPPSPEAVAAQQDLSLSEAWSVATRPRLFALLGALALLAVLGSVMAVKRFGVREFFELPVPELRGRTAQTVRRSFAAAVAVGTPQHDSCDCVRPTSALWGRGIGQLSVLISPRIGRVDRLWVKPGETAAVFHQSEDPSSDAPTESSRQGDDEPDAGPDARGKAAKEPRSGGEVEFDLAVVNNSATALNTVSLVVTFARRTATGRRTAIMERGLFYPATLKPAQAIRWRVRAEGTEFRVDCPVTDKLGTVPVAEVAGFRRLLSARLMAVRVHGAMMLSYLRQPRARQDTMALGPLTALEENARKHILHTLEPLYVCERKLVQDGLSLCVHNGTKQLHRALLLAELDAPSAKRRSWQIDDLFLPGRGLRVVLSLDGARAPRALAVQTVATP